jgi:hypothetical protein
MRLTIHFHLAPRLRMSGAAPPLRLYAFMVYVGRTLPFVKICDDFNFKGVVIVLSLRGL